MNESKNLELDFSLIIPPHKCEIHLKILEQTHSVNSLHNIVIYQKAKCKICGKIFEKSDPRGIK